ncbi:hypothetical protein M8C17_20120 [Micromonospora sp. RHAY321]|uniref:hypothetical protein n=1 Tax=Micromonospora sp. RHAY321 TaxID=2944807 RepID=UPI00207CAA41|nr:hypothetical protein [Micromonospora sp. RHAY321]MCO1597461.1 hypothetical protein [Micromonospora sp. RHAY321]
MSAFLLSVHVLAAILAIGPVAIAASMFPRYARLALAAPGDPRTAVAVRILHRITRVYAVIGVLVPVFGLATGASIGVLGDTWLIVSMILTAAAAAVLVAFILPGQRRVVGVLDTGVEDAREVAPDGMARRLGMLTGVFNLLWAIVVVLMIYRPGSTTGVGL